VVWLLAGGVALVLVGQLLNGAMPINKPIWTVSYSLFMGGLASLCLGLWYWVADAAKFQLRWLLPVEWMGRNAILLYMLSGLLADACSMIRVGPVTLRAWLYGEVFGSFLSPINASLAFGLLNVLLLGLVAWGLNSRKWYLKF
jgi:predicted acyltransferase